MQHCDNTYLVVDGNSFTLLDHILQAKDRVGRLYLYTMKLFSSQEDLHGSCFRIDTIDTKTLILKKANSLVVFKTAVTNRKEGKGPCLGRKPHGLTAHVSHVSPRVQESTTELYQQILQSYELLIQSLCQNTVSWDIFLKIWLFIVFIFTSTGSTFLTSDHWARPIV